MFLRVNRVRRKGKTYRYYQLVESVRTAQGPRHRVVAHLGDLGRMGRREWAKLARKLSGPDSRLPQDEQLDLFESAEEARVAPVMVDDVSWENPREYGSVAVGWYLWGELGLEEIVEEHVGNRTHARVRPAVVAAVLAIGALCVGRSENALADWIRHTALPELLGIDPESFYNQRLYRGLDYLVNAKEKIEEALAERLRGLFRLDYDLLFYDITNTYFEGMAEGNELAAYGLSKEKRSDCPLVGVALVVTPEGFPLYHEVFRGNQADSETVPVVVKRLEARFGKARRILVMDRGMVSEGNLSQLRRECYDYIVCARRSQLDELEREVVREEWEEVRQGVRVMRHSSGDEVFVICVSQARREKERAIRERFERRITEGLERLSRAIETGRLKRREVVERRVGKILEQNKKAARFFEISYRDGSLVWEKKPDRLTQARNRDGHYLIRTTLKQLSAREIWESYIRLGMAEEAFRLMKSLLKLRPVYHQVRRRVEAHVFVCVLGYLLLRAMHHLHRQRGGQMSVFEILEHLRRHQLADIVLRTREGKTIRLRRTNVPDRTLKAIYATLNFRPQAIFDTKP